MNFLPKRNIINFFFYFKFKDLHFKLATRKTSGSHQEISGQGANITTANSRPSSSSKKQIEECWMSLATGA